MKKLFLLFNLCFIAYELHLLVQIKEKRERPVEPQIPPVHFLKPAPFLERSQDEQANALLLHLIKEKEGFSAKPYLCPAGKLTIGYGFTASKYIRRKTITEKEASRILREEIIPFYAAKVDEIVKVPLSAFQRAALISFCYNCGEENLSRLVNGRGRLNSGDYSSTPRIMQRYTKASGKTLQGLVSRREQEAKLFLGCL